MMSVYSGWDALNTREYEELIEEMMMNDIADENARDYFENEIEKDAEGR